MDASELHESHHIALKPLKRFLLQVRSLQQLSYKVVCQLAETGKSLTSMTRFDRANDGKGWAGPCCTHRIWYARGHGF